MKQILNRYQFDDMMVCYEINDEKQVGLFLYPADKPLEKCANPDTAIDSLVQLKIAGDMYNGAYAPGNTLRNGECSLCCNRKPVRIYQMRSYPGRRGHYSFPDY